MSSGKESAPELLCGGTVKGSKELLVLNKHLAIEEDADEEGTLVPVVVVLITMINECIDRV